MTQLDSLLEVVSPRTGIMKSLTLRIGSADQPALPIIYDGMLSHFDFRKAEAMERGSCGKGVTESAAKLSAIGEALERYCASHPVPDDLRRSAIEALGDEAVAPPEFVLFSENQYARQDFGYWRWRPEDEIVWTRMTKLGGGQVWIPAALVYLGSVSAQYQDMLCMPTSSGFAAGPNLNQAILAALLELIERDAFMIGWLARTPAPEIELKELGGIVNDIRSTYQHWGTKIRVFALPTDLPATVILALALDETGHGPAAIAGLGCGMNPYEAVRKALFEICQMHEPLRRKNSENAAAKLNHYSDVKTLDEHAAYFFRRDHFHELDFLLRSPTKLPLKNLADHSSGAVDEDLRTLERGIAAAGYRGFYRDLTTPDLDPYPIRVARALVTGLLPISFGHGQERIASKRLYERGGVDETSLNPCPHPLA